MGRDAIFRRIPDQIGGTADLLHHVVARIYAGRAAHAFHLRAVPDIDPGRADLHALQAVDAIAGRRVGFLGEFLPGFAAPVVIGDDHGVAVQEYALQTPIRTDDGAGLFPEKSIDRIKNARED